MISSSASRSISERPRLTKLSHHDSSSDPFTLPKGNGGNGGRKSRSECEAEVTEKGRFEPFGGRDPNGRSWHWQHSPHRAGSSDVRGEAAPSQRDGSSAHDPACVKTRKSSENGAS